MKLNRRYYRFVELKVTEKKLRFSGGLTEYFPPNPQLVNPQAPVAQKIAEEVIFRRFQGEGA